MFNTNTSKICMVTILLLIGFFFTSCKENRMKKDDLFQEKYRPQIHFTPEKGWMNDPNGMVYLDGEYHLFYQHYPDKSEWGPMHWGHAISKDLVHWEHMPIALYPDSLGYIFSGSAVYDKYNTSGLGTVENPPLIAFFTYHNMKAEKEERYHEIETQAIAYSLDNGRNWTKYANNPIIKNPGLRDFRDPKVFWHEDTRKWIMSIASGQVIQFYTSANCIDWQFSGEFGEGKGSHDGVWECPDLFPLEVSGTNETKWVLIVNINPGGPGGGSATQYFVGEFDGSKFTSDQEVTLWMDYGKDNYAGVTWSNAPENRRILIGWMNNWQYAGEKPTYKWSGAATFPRELGLIKNSGRYLLTSTPVKEIENLYGNSSALTDIEIIREKEIFEKISFAKTPAELLLTFNVRDNSRIDFPGRYGIRFKNTTGESYTIAYDNVDKFFYIDRTNATSEIISDYFPSEQMIPYIIKEDQITWRIILDTSSVEFFTAEGLVVVTNVVYPTEPFDIIELFAENGKISLKNVEIRELKSIWK